MIVADTNLVVHLFTQTSLTSIAQQVLAKDSNWILPKLWQEEYANVLCKLARKGYLTSEEVISHFNYTTEQFKNNEISIDITKVIKTSLEYGITVYDANFISLAIDHNILVVTEDQEMLKKCPKLAVNMLNFIESY